MNSEVFKNINKIIERESKSSTYKFALLRGVIDILQDNSPYIALRKGRAYIPTGLLIEKWLLYYYPILQSHHIIPQITGAKNSLAFQDKLVHLVKAYSTRNGLSGFYNDLRYKGIPQDLNNEFFALAKQMRNTITKMPMKYIGSSINNSHYSIFQVSDTKNNPIRKRKSIDINSLIFDFGIFSIPVEYYEAFRLLGNFINGRDSLLFKWAEFSVNLSAGQLSVDKVLNEFLKDPVTDRNILESKKFYQSLLEKEGQIYCVWTGSKIKKYDIDHVIPFSVWKNNDLWNLLPSKSSINNTKRDKIPAPELIDRQSELILDYWGKLQANYSEQFQKEIQIALLGDRVFQENKQEAMEHLKSRCVYLIENRGFEAWNNHPNR
jgi:hypothetical protein